MSNFRLDKYEVTVGRFRAFAGAWTAGWRPPAQSGKHSHLDGGQGLANSGTPNTQELGWDPSNGIVDPTNTTVGCYNWPTWTAAPGNNENLPINCVTWWESYAFCIWDGGFLPSETEWEYAAAGGPSLRQYPWGQAPPDIKSEYAIYGCYYPSASGVCDKGVGNIAPVGTPTQGAGLWGQLDLAGNVLEWNLDYFADYVSPCNDCANLSVTNGDRATHGGNFTDTTTPLLPPSHYNVPPASRYDILGFRCARPP